MRHDLDHRPAAGRGRIRPRWTGYRDGDRLGPAQTRGAPPAARWVVTAGVLVWLLFDHAMTVWQQVGLAGAVVVFAAWCRIRYGPPPPVSSGYALGNVIWAGLIVAGGAGLTFLAPDLTRNERLEMAGLLAFGLAMLGLDLAQYNAARRRERGECRTR